MEQGLKEKVLGQVSDLIDQTAFGTITIKLHKGLPHVDVSVEEKIRVGFVGTGWMGSILLQ